MLCKNCNKREGTTRWVGNGGVMDLVHGMYQMWCEICATEAQLEYAKERAKAISKLERKLKKLYVKNNRQLVLQ